MLQKLKSFGLVVPAFVWVVVFAILMFFIVHLGGDVVVPFILPWLVKITNFLLIAAILIFPFGFISEIKGYVGFIYILFSKIFYLSLLSFGFLVTYFYWGAIGVVIGALMMGFGVVLTGFVSSLLNGGWELLANLVYLTVMAYGMGMLGVFWIEKAEQIKNEKIQSALEV